MKKLLLAVILGMCCLSAHAQSAPPVPAVNETLIQWDPDAVWDSQTASFPVERKAEACSGSGAFVEVAQVTGQTWYLDKGLTRGVTYCYRVFRLGTGVLGKSGPSNLVAKTIPLVPTAPANLRVQ